MLGYSSSSVLMLLITLLNPHHNISLLSTSAELMSKSNTSLNSCVDKSLNAAILNNNFMDTNHASCQLPTSKQGFWQRLYNKSRNFNLRYTLHREARDLNKDVIDKVVTSLQCAKKFHIEHKPILTVIDYSLPSNQKRLWVFDLDQGILLYHTYVGHGIASGALLTDSFSNRNNSKASSIGIYITDKAYFGREGMSMRLTGIDGKFNNNAANRYIVMHGGWYMDPNFIKQYGRSGRSWGCPALPLAETKDIIETIKDKTFLVAYYPSDKWFKESRFLNCKKSKTRHASISAQDSRTGNYPQITSKVNSHHNLHEYLEPIDVTKAPRESVLFAPIGKEKAIMVINAQKYAELFNTNPPLERMLRRRINNHEYIAISTKELQSLIVSSANTSNLNTIKFVTPVVRNHRGYFVTEMEFATKDKIDTIQCNDSQQLSVNKPTKFTVKFLSGKNLDLSATNKFIRWLGV